MTVGAHRPTRLVAAVAFTITAAVPGTARVADPAPIRVRHRVAAQSDSLRFVTADTGNHARYRVREQLVGFDLPNDAIGTTDAVTGTVAMGANGKVSPQSGFTIDVTSLKSDQRRRDGYVQGRILETAKFPTVTFTVTDIDNLRLPLPTTGSRIFSLKGDLTVHGVTRPATWRVTADIAGSAMSGTAETRFTFEDFGLLRPKVPVLLSVEDTIALEYAFRMIRK